MTDPTDEQDWETVAMWVDQSAQDAFSHLRSKYEELEKANEGWPAVIEDAHKRLSDKVTEVKQLQGEVELWKSRTRLAEQGESSLGDEVERLRTENYRILNTVNEYAEENAALRRALEGSSE